MERLDVETDRRLYIGVTVRMMLSGPVIMLALILPKVAPLDYGAVAVSIGLFLGIGVVALLASFRPSIGRSPPLVVTAIVLATSSAGAAMVASQDLANTVSLGLLAAMAFQLSVRHELIYTLLAWTLGSGTFVLAQIALGAPAEHVFTRGVVFAGMTGVLLATIQFLVSSAYAGRGDARALARVARSVAMARELSDGFDAAESTIAQLTGAVAVNLWFEEQDAPFDAPERVTVLPLGVSGHGPVSLVLSDVGRRDYVSTIVDLLAPLCERDRVLGELFRHSRTDPVTGVENRRALDEAIANDVDTHDRSVVMLDLDRFKEFNDRHGHLAGDELLGRFARTLEAHVRPGDHVTRYGGEEFCLVLQTDADSASAVVDRVRSGWKRQEEAVTFSAGIAEVAHGEADGTASALARADRALYRAKEAGRDRTEVDRGDIDLTERE